MELEVKNPTANAGDIRVTVQFLSQEDPLRRKWQLTPVFLPGQSSRQRSLVGYSSWGRKESDTTEQNGLVASKDACNEIKTSKTLAVQTPQTRKRKNDDDLRRSKKKDPDIKSCFKILNMLPLMINFTQSIHVP